VHPLAQLLRGGALLVGQDLSDRFACVLPSRADDGHTAVTGSRGPDLQVVCHVVCDVLAENSWFI